MIFFFFLQEAPCVIYFLAYLTFHDGCSWPSDKAGGQAVLLARFLFLSDVWGLNPFSSALSIAASSGPIFPLLVISLFLFGCVRLSVLTLKLNNLIRMGFAFVLIFLY